MVYAMAGGNTDYDPTLDGEPGNFFEGMEGKLRAAEVADLTPDGGGAHWQVLLAQGALC
ncbi:hypothetical protein [Phaeobacter piscinae]|uniref:hypothetical protein n=1 Tax=Phaeobacter piscinae TaxID=1580596 RepID=UPI000AE4ED3E|nr:hypothetical protein [Phaeobacter piscinae]UTS81873.1 hypothetical protein OL67_002968 [Phaeobacter piscinae]